MGADRGSNGGAARETTTTELQAEVICRWAPTD